MRRIVKGRGGLVVRQVASYRASGLVVPARRGNAAALARFSRRHPVRVQLPCWQEDSVAAVGARYSTSATSMAPYSTQIPSLGKSSTVLVLWTSRKKRHVPFIRQAVAFLQVDMGFTVFVEDENVQKLVGGEALATESAVPPEDLFQQVDLAITFGRHDAIAMLSQLFPERAPPALSIKSTSTEAEDSILQLERCIRRVVEGDVKIVNRLRIACRIRQGPMGPVVVNRSLVHEAVVHRAPFGTPTVTKVHVDDLHFTTIVSDGLIVSTPSGSTGYSRSAGGAVMHPSLQCFHITPINSTSLSVRPIVLPVEAKVKFNWQTQRGVRPLMLVMDGTDVQLSSDDTVEINAAPYPLPSISFGP